MFLATMSYAWESEGNPDRHVSFGFHVANGTLNGSGVSTEYLYSPTKVTNIPVEDLTDNELTLWSLNPSMRFPVSNRLTIDMGYSYVHQEQSALGNLTRVKSKVSGGIYQIGFRYYFPD